MQQAVTAHSPDTHFCAPANSTFLPEISRRSFFRSAAAVAASTMAVAAIVAPTGRFDRARRRFLSLLDQDDATAAADALEALIGTPVDHPSETIAKLDYAIRYDADQQVLIDGVIADLRRMQVRT